MTLKEKQDVCDSLYHGDCLAQVQQITSPCKGEDRISHLPPDIIGNILGRLVLADAVRTSLLSRHWRYIWRSACGLRLHFCQGRKDFTTFADFVEGVFALITGSIGGLFISVYEYHRPAQPDEYERRSIDSWVLHALRLGATSLEVQDNSFRQKLELSSDLLSYCQGLEALTLYNCRIRIPEPSIVPLLPRLVKLHVTSCVLEEGGLRLLLASCPNLRILSAILVGGLEKLELVLPELRDFSFSGLVTDDISLERCPYLQRLQIELYPPKENNTAGIIHPPQGLLHLFRGTCNLIQSLELGGYTLKKLSRSFVPHKLGWEFKCLKYFMVRMDPRSLGEISVALCLLRSSPVLEILNISAGKGFAQEDVELHHFWNTKESLDCSLDLLTHLDIGNLRLEFAHMEFCKFLLANTPILKSFYVRPLTNCTIAEDYEIKEQLWSYDQIASPYVDIQ